MRTNPLQRSIFQNAWVVDDIEAACHSWVKNFAVGPFYIYQFGNSFKDVIYRGAPGQFEIVLALAQAGPLQIELIQPVSQPSVYRDSVPAGSMGFHHVCAWTDDIDADSAHFQAINCPSVCSAASGSVRFAYFDTRAIIGCMFEVVTKTSDMVALFQQVSDAAIDWDGRNPVRYAT
ncbi:MAG: VOC family protein [Porticoccaceae bacterium]|nr:VOC family protein [Porticoccaceae bacterium]